MRDEDGKIGKIDGKVRNEVECHIRYEQMEAACWKAPSWATLPGYCRVDSQIAPINET